jgi:tRNA A-37 threonylcarbamoyl transferase component Bud32
MGEAPPQQSPSPVAVGDVLLKRYRLVELLAEGGHSFVYRAQDERLRRPACVKLLRRSAIDPIFRRTIEQRFVQEAFLLARLNHPSTIRVYDFGYVRAAEPDEPELPFQVCELIGGGPLSRWVKRRIRLDPHEVVGIVLPLARALAEVHGAGLVHLDVKPQNILLVKTPSGREPKLADFGIAQSVQSGVPDGTNSVLLYSVNWAAPEQMVGDPVSASCDVYSLALVAAYALTGRLVYQDGDPAQAYRLRKYSDEVLANALANAALPDEVVAVLLRACRFNPAHRIADVLEFAQLLGAAFGDLVVGPPGAPAAAGEDSTPLDVTVTDRSLPGWVTAANLWPLSVGAPCPPVGGRTLRFVPLAPSADLEPSERIRLRVSMLPASADRPGLHILGLNCFVSVAGRRPSNAVTLEASAPLEFFSAGAEKLGDAQASFATAGPQRSVVMMAGHSLVVPIDECPRLVALDFGAGSTCALLYDSGG